VQAPVQPHADASALLAAADAAVYQAKRAGRDRLVAHGSASGVVMSRAG
jgi:PleD family two-component response regulator